MPSQYSVEDEQNRRPHSRSAWLLDSPVRDRDTPQTPQSVQQRELHPLRRYQTSTPTASLTTPSTTIVRSRVDATATTTNNQNNNNNNNNKNSARQSGNSTSKLVTPLLEDSNSDSNLSFTISAISKEIDENLHSFDPIENFDQIVKVHHHRSTSPRALGAHGVLLSSSSSSNDRISNENKSNKVFSSGRNLSNYSTVSSSSSSTVGEFKQELEEIESSDSTVSSYEMQRLNESDSSTHNPNQSTARNATEGQPRVGYSDTHRSSIWIRLRDALGRKPKRGQVQDVKPPRKLFIHRPQEFVHNGIATAKYTLLSFLPQFLFEQFRRYSNIFFLFIGLMQQIPNVSPTGRFTTAVPLSFIMFVSAVKEVFEDWKRHAADKMVNSAEVKVLGSSGSTLTWVTKTWRDVVVGDLILVQQNNFFPSDLVLLSSKEPNGLCYIETSNLDGETNLKARSALIEVDALITKSDGQKKVLDLKKLKSSTVLQGKIECDAPNKMLYEFTGKLCFDDKEIPMRPENILLRGAQMRNTEWAVGVVIYTGHETKLMMNSMAKTPLKQSHVEILTNQQILALLGILIFICLISASFSVMWVYSNNDHWYISELGLEATANFFLILLTFIILYNNLIPISLQVTLEMVRIIQAHFINCDLMMYCEETDTPAQARTSNLNEELGHVRYILSDKTGTLTRNVMEFKKCSIAGVIYDERRFYRLLEIIRKRESDWETVREFLILLAVCHTVIPEPSKESGSKFVYTASSPDEAALVKGAQKIGFEFLQRTPQQVVIDAMGSTEKYDILHVLEFNSDRKRMSVIVRTPSGKLKIYIKGADSMIEKRLTTKEKKNFAPTEQNLTTFAKDGLRTLCVGSANITEEQYKDWDRRYTKAMLLQNDQVNDKGQKREEALNAMMDEIEDELTLLGATAIEDKLQEGVPDTIEQLMRAGINVWMLTGDKQETATNIAYSCRLLKNAQDTDTYHIINEQTQDATREAIIGAELKLKNNPDDFTLIIDNKSLNYALTPELQSTFMDVALLCRSVICCRVSPAQKAEIVDAVKKSTKCITLAIGDGANDVAMIRAANVGVGISGREGLQAVYSSDYSIAQFRFLARLLLVHGSWSLSRVCKLILFSFYKNIALYVIELWFATVSAWSGQAIFERWSLSFYNVIFTAWPPLAIGLFDRISSADVMLKYPELYSDQWGQFNIKKFWGWILAAIWHSLVLFWVTFSIFRHDTLWANGKSDGGYLCFGNILFTYVVVTVCLKAALEMNCWTVVTHFAIWGSILSWFIFLTVYSRVWPTLPVGPDMAGMDRIIFSSWLFWLGLVVVPVLSLQPDLVYKLINRTVFKSLGDRIMELEEAKRLQVTPDHSFFERTRMAITSFFSRRPAPPLNSSLPNQTNSRPNPSTNVAGQQNSRELNLDHAVGSSIDAALKRSEFARSRFASSDAEIDAAHGYSFSQEETRVGSPLSQSNVIRMYSTKM